MSNANGSSVEFRVDKLENGFVIDHIAAGSGVRIYKHLKLDELKNGVALLQNVRSEKYGRKDLIKIEGNLTVDLDMLGYIDPNITVVVVRDGEVIDKKETKLPDKLVNIVNCKNPRCITSTEAELTQEFNLTDRANRVYRCTYCEQSA
ncbi:MAG: aspartate carbamoyltransferase regulatory subunit [Defluviitaleaceae bacterium]|nr:aspartate carbamoyltransferase regulatory subunit [Defluviitaleaceae bacterium]